jgi:Zn-dependent protease with chaperone function
MVDDRGPARVAAKTQMSEHEGSERTGSDPVRRAVRLVAVTALIPAVVLGLIGLLGGVIVALVVFVVVAAVIAGLVWRSAPARVESAIGGRPADARADARLLNLVDGLCTATGLRPPTVRVVESPGLNVLVAGLGPADATLAVTSGLLGALTRVELEGVLADGLVAIRHRRMVPGTVAASLPPFVGRAFGVDRPDDEGGDRAAVGLTRYPPGLVGALEKMDAMGTVVDTRPSLAGLWLADPRPGAPAGTRPPLARRIEALEQL